MNALYTILVLTDLDGIKSTLSWYISPGLPRRLIEWVSEHSRRVWFCCVGLSFQLAGRDEDVLGLDYPVEKNNYDGSRVSRLVLGTGG